MKTRSLFLFLFIAMMLPSTSSAQFGALKKAINKQIGNKVDSAADKKASENQKSGTKETGRGLFGGKIDIKYNDEYKFTGRIYMQMETYDKKDITKSDFFIYFNSNSMNAGMEVKAIVPEGEKSAASEFLFDNENKCFLIMVQNEDSKTGIISTLPSDSTLAAMGANQSKNQKDPDATTGDNHQNGEHKDDRRI